MSSACDDGGDLLPARVPGVHLRARARMQREHAARRRPGSAARSCTGSRISSFQPLRILHVTGRCVRRRDRADDLLHEVEVAQAARAAVAPHDLLDRAAEVDVDELGLEHVGHEARRLAHGHRIGAEDLHADRPLVRAERAACAMRRLVLPPDPLGRQELGDDDVRAVLRGRAAGTATPTRRPWAPDRAARRRRAGTESASSKATEPRKCKQRRAFDNRVGARVASLGSTSDAWPRRRPRHARQHRIQRAWNCASSSAKTRSSSSSKGRRRTTSSRSSSACSSSTRSPRACCSRCSSGARTSARRASAAASRSRTAGRSS